MSELLMYTIYDNPTDFSGWFVAREFKISAGRVISGDVIAKGRNLDIVRQQLPEGLHRIPRCPSDDKKIVEVWT